MIIRLLILAATISVLFSQDLTGVRICIDPGHSGHEIGGFDDDRFIEATGFWESESNLTKGLELRDILLGLNASVAITRTGNNNTSDDLSLSERIGIANAFNADYFNSIHSNGYTGTSNYSMVIYNGTTESPTNPQARVMSEIMAPILQQGNYTTHSISIGDLTLNPTWTYGYGVLVPANMPATISEGSFHDYIPESWRLMNLDYRKHEARSIARSIIEYFGELGFSTGSLFGMVKDSQQGVDYYTHSSLMDHLAPINNISVILQPGNLVYAGDTLNNGYFTFDSLAPGQYQLVVSADGFIADSSVVTVSANSSTKNTVVLDNNIPPFLVNSSPAMSDTSFPAWDPLLFDFSRAMSQSSVFAAFSMDPEVPGDLMLLENGTRLQFTPHDTLSYLTYYTVTFDGSMISIEGLAFDGDQNGMGGDGLSLFFRTGPRDFDPPNIVSITTGVEPENLDIRPIFNIRYDEPIDVTTVNSQLFQLVRVSNLQPQAAILEHVVIDGASLVILSAQNDLEPAEDYRVVVFPGVEDQLGNPQEQGEFFDFTTANYNYTSEMIDDFESYLFTNWWHPDSSGSTVGTQPNHTYIGWTTGLTVRNQLSTAAMILVYGWNPEAPNWLVREYLNDAAPGREVHFTSESILQAYVFGDGYGNQFRFCVDDDIEGEGTHEVSPWVTIDWLGWRLVSWDMSVDGTGEWLGDGTLDGTLEFDSFQLTHVPGSETHGMYRFDELRVVSRNYLPVEENGPERPLVLEISPNYPNPFNPWTNIPFSLPEAGEITINVFDLKGRKVDALFSGRLPAGRHMTRWNASDLAGGIYLIRMTSNETSITHKVTVLK